MKNFAIFSIGNLDFSHVLSEPEGLHDKALTTVTPMHHYRVRTLHEVRRWVKGTRAVQERVGTASNDESHLGHFHCHTYIFSETRVTHGNEDAHSLRSQTDRLSADALEVVREMDVACERNEQRNHITKT